MRIGLNLLYLLPGVVGGTETYARRLVESLSAIDNANEYVIFLNRESGELPLHLGSNFTRAVCPVNATVRGARYAWEQSILPLQAVKQGLDVLHSMGYVGPLVTPCRHIVSIHDLNFRSLYVDMPPFKRRILGAMVKRVGRRAAHVLTLSDCSKTQIVEYLGIPEHHVTTIYLAPETMMAPLARNDLVIPSMAPYIAVFGGAAPHKNIPRLIAAFASIAPKVPHRLVIIGHTPPDGSIAVAIAEHRVGHRVTMTGYLEHSMMIATLAGADLLAFPSLYEGFGLPLLDAQALGVPVVCSNAAAIPEVAGAGALMFDPLSVESMSAALLAPLVARSVRETLIQAGAHNVKRFSWSQTAALTLRAYEQACENGSR